MTTQPQQTDNKHVISEHGNLPNGFMPHEQYGDAMCLNEQEEVQEFYRRCFFSKQHDCKLKKKVFKANYVIGAQWVKLEDESSDYLVIRTEKVEKIDFMQMFATCLQAGIESERFSRIYGIDIAGKKIETNVFRSVLSPLIVTHFLLVVKQIVSKGLKKDYVQREDNLRKVKGKILIIPNERKNIIPKRFDRVYCSYQEYTEDTLENRLLKKALLFANQMLIKAGGNESCRKLQQQVRTCLAAFVNVGNDIVISQIQRIKPNKLFKEYQEAIRLAKLILQRYDYNLSNVNENDAVPPFWLDMPLLFEIYVVGKLREWFGQDIIYQAHGKTGYPDFLDKKHKLILDTKYKKEEKIERDTDIVRQLAGYARDVRILEHLGEDISNPRIVPCVFICPDGEKDELEKGIEHIGGWHQKGFNWVKEKNTKYNIAGLVGFYKIPVLLPTMK